MLQYEWIVKTLCQMKYPSHKTQVSSGSTYVEVCRIVICIDSENRIVAAKGWEEGMERDESMEQSFSRWKTSGNDSESYRTLWMHLMWII
jgi:hypothetical protein